MSFASLTFLFLFLPVFFAIYYAALAMRFSVSKLNGIALLSSILFYTWGAPRFVPVLFVSCLFDYFLSHRMAVLPTGDSRRRRFLTASIVLNVSCLLYFKYANFFVGQLDILLAGAGGAPLAWTPVILPIGISFITFEKLSYMIDVYRGRTEPAPTIVTFLLFIALFPHLIAGPIFRYHDLAHQLSNRSHTLEDATSGMLRFVLGLSKKVLIADTLALIADRVFALPPAELSFGRAWLGIFAYSFQIYFDFSGYSDMAIGLGRMMGFHFLENFNHPYISQSITEFWHRWHISLSNWLREYLYFPLGGNRISPLRTYLNLWTVFLVSGFWHGANWTFIVWGSYHGFFLMLDRLFLLRVLERMPRVFRVSLTFLIVMCGWVLFRSESLAQAGSYLSALFIPTGAPPGPSLTLMYDLTNRVFAAFVLAAALSFLPLSAGLSELVNKKLSSQAGPLPFAFCGASAFVLLVLSAAALTNSSFHPFIYFRF